MSRIARVVVPGLPYHVTHRGNLRSAVFFTQQDREIYLGLLEQHANKEGLAVWAYCLMTNSVHLIVAPEREDSCGRSPGTRTHAVLTPAQPRPRLERTPYFLLPLNVSGTRSLQFLYPKDITV